MLCSIDGGLMENRSGLLEDVQLTYVAGDAKRLAALEMIEPIADRPRAIALSTDRCHVPPTS